ncbi:glutamine and serine-rich protein 1 [Chanos chanos]|uniref:Glutamine and serine-rich protein 1 n=1 Tax=Chanos chanos TaxID=29144 RepID=A0A6J2UQ60_CHACN|nr:glutamine and serine-rich protein 1 [Chanos chanos]
MMDRNYPTSSFTDPLASPAQTAVWAYERSTACIKPSSSYGATHLESELLQRQTYASNHQHPTYSTTHHSAGLTGVFDTSLHSAGSNTTESSVTNFFSAIDTRGLQAGPAATSLLPQFRTPSWQTGTNSSSTELFLTGALPSSGTFSTPATLSSYQHHNAFSTRSFTTTAVAVQDATYTTSNGLLSPHDPLLSIKSSQGTVPTALAFDRLGNTSLSASLPPQSSTYRSAQESAPHLLQPQFSLLPTALGNSQQVAQPYGASVFSGSIERTLQRECSVIKHHQRPSSTQSVQEQLPGSAQHSLQGYMSGDSDVAFQHDPSRQTPVPCSPAGDSAHTVNGNDQQKAVSQAALQQTQAYSSSVPSPVFSSSSGVKAKDCSSKITQQSNESVEPHSQSDSPDRQQQNYPSSVKKQSSVIASQSQPYTSVQLPSLISISQSQTYITSQSLPIGISQSQTLSSNHPEKLPSIYKTLSSFSSQSESVTSVSQSLNYSSGQQQGLSSSANSEQYGAEVEELCLGTPSQNYSSTHPQGLPTVSYYAQGLASAMHTQSYASEQSLTPSPSFSSTRSHGLLTSNSTQDYMLMQPSESKNDVLLQQPQKCFLPVHSPPSSTASHAQALHNNQSSVELKTVYGKGKLDESVFLTSKDGVGVLPIQNVQALQQTSLVTPTQIPSGSELGPQSNVVYVVAKMEDRHNTQSVIRSNSRSEDQILGLAPITSIKDERMGSLNQHGQLVTCANNQATPDPKKSVLIQASHLPLSSDELKQHPLLLKATSSTQQQNHPTQTIRIPQPDPDHGQETRGQTQFIRVPSAQVVLEPSQMVLLQQPLLHTGQTSSKPASQMQSLPVQYLQSKNEMISASVNGGQNQNQVVNQQGSSTTETGKQHMSPKDHFSQLNLHDTKHHFALSSICFPESMLLADERNILSNVDDILAATAAACGVTPQDFVKATSSEGGAPLTVNPTDSKCHHQSAENRHESHSFPSQHSITANSQTITLTLNGDQLTTDLQRYPKGAAGGHHAFTMSNSQTQQGVSTTINNSQQQLTDKEANCLKNVKIINNENEEKNHAISKGHCENQSNGSGPKSSGGGINNDMALSDFSLAGQESELISKASLLKSKSQTRGAKGIKIEEGLIDCPGEGLPKKKARSKGSSKLPAEEENSQSRSQKRNSQGKRQNSRGSETGSSSTSEGCHDGYQQQERMRQKIREVEEKQPEVKTGFIGSFLDFLKSGPKQHFSSLPIRSPNRTRKPSASSKRPSGPLPMSCKLQSTSATLTPDTNCVSSSKRLEEELQKNLETLPSFSSDEDESVGRNQDLQKSITSALSSLDEPMDKKLKPGIIKQEPSSSAQLSAIKVQEEQKATQKELSAQELLKDVAPDQLAVQLSTVAIEGLTDEELSDSGGEGMYRERDEFVVKNEDIEGLKITLKTGVEPPAIWKVQKALLQKFIPELRDGKRVFSATNSYLGYFGDAKTMYRRVYVKFLDTVNKREYVRVCSRKPRCKPMHSMRGSQAKALLAHRMAPSVSDTSTFKLGANKPLSRPKPKQQKAKAEPPPKKRKRWKEEFSASPSDSSLEAVSEDDEFMPPVPFATRFLNTRTMKETFRSFVELLISVALDADVMVALERENDELLLPHMKRVDGMITDNRRRLLPKLRMGQLFKNALDSFPELSVVTELKTDGETPTFKVRLSGKAYNRKTMKPSKSPNKLPLEYTVDQQKTHWFSLYHSLQHYKYHTYLMCMEEIASLRSRGEDLGQEETVQTCLGNRAWVEGLFDRFGELITQVQQACL